MEKKEHTKREAELFKAMVADRTASKLQEHSPVNEIIYMNDYFVEFHQKLGGKPDADKLEELIKQFLIDFEGKELREYRKALKQHLKRLKFKYSLWKQFTEKFLYNAMLDRFDEMEMMNK
jgi:hypothetical protein